MYPALSKIFMAARAVAVCCGAIAAVPHAFSQSVFPGYQIGLISDAKTSAYYFGTYSDTVDDLRYLPGAGPLARSDSAAFVFAGDNVGDNGSGAAYATFGRLGATSSASADGRAPLGSSAVNVDGTGQSQAGASWVDLLTPNWVGHAGENGSMTFSMRVSGSLAVSTGAPNVGAASQDTFRADGVLRMTASRSTPTQGDPYNVTTLASVTSEGQARISSSNYQYFGDTFLRTVSMTVPIVWGSPIWLQVALGTSTYADVNRPLIGPGDPAYYVPRNGNAAAGFYDTASWTGISSVLDANGHAVSNWTVPAASGTDWTQNYAATVPEAPSLAMMLGGLLLFMLGRRPQTAARA